MKRLIDGAAAESGDSESEGTASGEPQRSHLDAGQADPSTDSGSPQGRGTSSGRPTSGRPSLRQRVLVSDSSDSDGEHGGLVPQQDAVVGAAAAREAAAEEELGAQHAGKRRNRELDSLVAYGWDV